MHLRRNSRPTTGIKKRIGARTQIAAALLRVKKSAFNLERKIMGSWFDNNIQKTHGPRISKEMAEALGVFDKATGLRRKPDGSLEVFGPPTLRRIRKQYSGIFKLKKSIARLY